MRSGRTASPAPREREHIARRLSADGEVDEKALLEGLLAQDPRAYETLVRAYGKRVMAAARRYLRSGDDASDVFQETFIQVMKSIDKFEGRSTLWYWVRGITVKLSLLKLRQQRRRNETSFEDLLPQYDDAEHRILPESPRSTADEVEKGDVGQYVREAIAELPEQYRTILVLRDFEGHSTQETADILGIQANTAKVRLHRARSALRTLLER
ncbi:MAG: sigma-70 family RNA polymerase sigma factor, partial [Pseudomonadota bacterium]